MLLKRLNSLAIVNINICAHAFKLQMNFKNILYELQDLVNEVLESFRKWDLT